MSLISGRGQRHDLSGPPILVTENVEDYRKSIYDYLHSYDVVLELGCAQGVTTSLIGERVKEVSRMITHAYAAPLLFHRTAAISCYMSRL
jgi:hypothetical protein